MNPLALEEFAALEERYNFLATQLEDVKKARQHLAFPPSYRAPKCPRAQSRGAPPAGPPRRPSRPRPPKHR
ncbi:hypothetical protein [Nocardia flavorosea]|uniref:hypothetical protein n=1 Tax=Nocardia flavorosea TaxID=53429 RepID=UPI0024549DD3|nr:hypothetical protein [Nocardia flavorosea]